MNFYFVKTPKIIRLIYKNYLWKVDTKNKIIYLTFDDGPTTEVTEFVLDTLKQYNAKATFFCIGKNIEQNPILFKKITSQGHAIGNHTQHHLNGWKTKTLDYISDVEECQETIDFYMPTKIESKLFRPAYGKITKSQSKKLIKNGYKIIMWTVLSGDFDISLSPITCHENVINNSNLGSIIVFHDSKKAFCKIKKVLPRTLDYFTKNGYLFKSL
jgi:peptidoglycan/xylan/chitin deacetylase (PgdA/CDA1 family)